MPWKQLGWIACGWYTSLVGILNIPADAHGWWHCCSWVWMVGSLWLLLGVFVFMFMLLLLGPSVGAVVVGVVVVGVVGVGISIVAVVVVVVEVMVVTLVMCHI